MREGGGRTGRLRARRGRAALGAALLLAAAGAPACGGPARGDSPYRVYVMLGFHSNFYHSWRGDTPDEAGFGTDIRLVRAILRMLDEAEAAGQQVSAYWDADNHFTLEQILPQHAPDILEGIARRVRAGTDEIVLAPYDNGLFHAMTPEEMRAVVRWSISNPWGSGALDLFGTYTPLLRPNEGMLTTGTLPILREEGIEGLVLAYSGWPFTTFSNFVPALPLEQRHNPTWLRLRPDGPRVVLFPCVSIADVLNHVSLETWLLELRAKQVSGEIQRDLVIHINFDADVDSWLPVDMPPGLGWFPNSGGLPEYIAAVNRYDWAAFTTPGRYLADHEPVGEVLVRRDLADGAFDGQYSWAEKLPSHALWTELERSRLAGRRAEAWMAGAPAERVRRAEQRLREGRDASFFQRLVALSTTHFGMSTPLVNEERQAVARRVVGRARAQAEAAERLLADSVAAEADGGAPGPDAAYVLRVRDLRRAGPTARSWLRVLLLWPGMPPAGTRLLDDRDRPVAHALGAPRVAGRGPGRLVATELLALLPLAPGETRTLRLLATGGGAPPEGAPGGAVLDEGALHLELSPDAGVASLRLGDWELAGPDFLRPFVSYRTRGDGRDPAAPAPVHPAGAWRLSRADPRWEAGGIRRLRGRTRIPIRLADPTAGPAAPPGPADPDTAEAELRVDWSVPPALGGPPFAVADVEVVYPYTPKRDLLHTSQQKLRRWMDLRWVEVAPFPLAPRLAGTREAPLRVWRDNWLGVTSSFPLDYARVNPANAELDAFNHQVTRAWVALGDGAHGLLVGQSAEVRSSYAFAPMRLREEGPERRQRVWINPFGSFYGAQLDYSHLGGTGLGTAWSLLGSSSLRPNGPSFNGARERFSLLLAPYAGDAPPEALRADAEAFFHPPAVVILASPLHGRRGAGGAPRLPRDLAARFAAAARADALRSDAPLAAPRAFLANPSQGAVDLVWDAPPPPDGGAAAGGAAARADFPQDPRLTGYEVAWRPLPAQAVETPEAAPPEAWRTERIGPGSRHRVEGLADGERYAFRMRAVGRPGAPGGGALESAWTPTLQATVGPVDVEAITDVTADAPVGLLLRTFWYGLVHVATTW